MAFENVFGNVDFQAPARSAQVQAAQFQQALGQGIANYQNQQRLDIQKRQLEQKASEFNLKSTAETALMKKNMGVPTTPEEEAAIATMAQIAPPVYTTDQFGRTISRPSGWSSVGSPVPQRAGNTGYGQGTNPAITQNYEDITPAMLAPMNISDIEAQVSPQGDMPEQLTQSPMLPPTPNYDVSPVGEIEAGKAKTGLARYAGEKNIDMQIAEQKEAMEKLKGMPKEEKRVLESAYEWKSTNDVLDEAIDMVSPYSAGVGSLTAVIPATPARNLAAKLNTVKADSAFGALQKMRDNSKTGGALGQVSERELALLESSQAPLDQAQSPQQLIAALNDYKEKRTQALSRVADAFEQDYGRRPKMIDDMLKEMLPKQKPTPEQAREILRKRGVIR